MASVLHEKKLKRWRISFALRLPAGPVYRSRYARDRAEADQLRRQLEAVETATRTGLAKASSIADGAGPARAFGSQNHHDIPPCP